MLPPAQSESWECDDSTGSMTTARQSDAHLDDRGDEPAIRHADSYSHIHVLGIGYAIAILRTRCNSTERQLRSASFMLPQKATHAHLLSGPWLQALTNARCTAAGSCAMKSFQSSICRCNLSHFSVCSTVRLDSGTCIQQRVLCQGQASGLGQQACHGDTLGLEPLGQRIQLVCDDGVAHAELWHLPCNVC